MAERKKPKITTRPVRGGTTTKTTTRTTVKTARATGTKATVLRARAASDDHSFARILQARSPEAVLRAAVDRFEEGRRGYAAEAETATAAELALLEAERARLRTDAPNDAARHGRVARAIAAVATELSGLRDLRREMERAVPPLPGGYTVVGRVLGRDGSVPEKAEVVFLGPDGRDLGLGALAVGKDGMVREAYPAEVAKKLEESGAQVTAVVRIGRRVVAREDVPVRVRAGRVHQFDLRIDQGG